MNMNEQLKTTGKDKLKLLERQRNEALRRLALSQERANTKTEFMINSRNGKRRKRRFDELDDEAFDDLEYESARASLSLNLSSMTDSSENNNGNNNNNNNNNDDSQNNNNRSNNDSRFNILSKIITPFERDSMTSNEFLFDMSSSNGSNNGSSDQNGNDNRENENKDKDSANELFFDEPPKKRQRLSINENENGRSNILSNTHEYTNNRMINLQNNCYNGNNNGNNSCNNNCNNNDNSTNKNVKKLNFINNPNPKNNKNSENSNNNGLYQGVKPGTKNKMVTSNNDNNNNNSKSKATNKRNGQKNKSKKTAKLNESNVTQNGKITNWFHCINPKPKQNSNSNDGNNSNHYNQKLASNSFEANTSKTKTKTKSKDDSVFGQTKMRQNGNNNKSQNGSKNKNQNKNQNKNKSKRSSNNSHNNNNTNDSNSNNIVSRARSAVYWHEPNQNELFNRLSHSKFRSKFKLFDKEIETLNKKARNDIENHCFEIICNRLAPRYPKNDGKQTPMRGHPVFIAQHATATCCRTCLSKWHFIPKNVQLTPMQIQYVVSVIMHWINLKSPNTKHN